MKNFQQTPKQRRVDLAKKKQLLRANQNRVWQPRAKNDPKNLELAMDKARCAGHAGLNWIRNSFWYW